MCVCVCLCIRGNHCAPRAAGKYHPHETKDYAELYLASELRTANEARLTSLQDEGSASALASPPGPPAYTASTLTKFKAVFHRTSQEYWRNPGYNLTRTVVLAVLGFIFGIIFFDIGTTDIAGVQSKIAMVFLSWYDAECRDFFL